jgi:hypothetical protein
MARSNIMAPRRSAKKPAAAAAPEGAPIGQPGTAGGIVLPPGSGQIVSGLTINPDPGSAGTVDRTLIRRQAIVVVHGQGQQRPMGTVRDFVERLWQRNPDLEDEPEEATTAAGTGTEHPGKSKEREFWIVPDGKTGLFELQRVTTPDYKGRRTDFFELYYADLLDNTPFRNLWRWLQRLVFINKDDIPPRMRLVWNTLRLGAALASLLCVWVILSLPQILQATWYESFVEISGGRLGLIYNWNLDFVSAGWIGLGLILVGGAWLALRHRMTGWLTPVQRLPAAMPVFVVLVGLGFVLWPSSPPFFAAVVLAICAYFATNEILPLFGDAASYLSAQTETVESRQRVRDRGLKLLRALHDDPDYDRVVIVAHSLGTVVAYDLLHLLWQAVGPTKQNPPRDALSALEEVDAFVTEIGSGSWDCKVDAYQALQWSAFNALRKQEATPAHAATKARPAVPAYPAGWKVSDLVTMGSPLGNATFLMAQGTKEFTQLKKERLMPTAPPRPFEATKHPTSFIDPDAKAAHHAAVFSVVRWTNMFDAHDETRFWLGDFISASVKDPKPEDAKSGESDGLFGSAMKDEPVTMRLTDGSRFFSHNHYWQDKDDWKRPLQSTYHLEIFRKAVGFDRPVPTSPPPSKAS